jgi:O-succinylbenzoic acid--CoA ligase
MDLLRSVLESLNINIPKDEDLVLLNPFLDQEIKAYSVKIARDYKLKSPHVWLSSSGSTNRSVQEFKLIALSQAALLKSAEAVNVRLKVHHEDRWLNVLPTYHVGGLGIFFRAYMSKSKVINLYHPTYKWSPEQFYQKLISEKITLTSLVPTQVFDLVANNYIAPPSVRAIVVGGAALPLVLYQQARKLGWPLLPSFGMTEVCSQIATASLDSIITDFGDASVLNVKFRSTTNNKAIGATINQSPSESENFLFPQMQVLDHVELKLDENQFLLVKSPSLMSCSIEVNNQSIKANHFQEEEWYKTQDYAKIKGKVLEVLGRGDDVIKILGEKVSLFYLRQKLEQVFSEQQFFCDWALIADKNLRKGNELILVINRQDLNLKTLLEKILLNFNKQVLPFEKITHIKWINSIPKTSMGKIQYGLLEESLKNEI